MYTDRRTIRNSNLVLLFSLFISYLFFYFYFYFIYFFVIFQNAVWSELNHLTMADCHRHYQGRHLVQHSFKRKKKRLTRIKAHAMHAGWDQKVTRWSVNARHRPDVLRHRGPQTVKAAQVSDAKTKSMAILLPPALTMASTKPEIFALLAL